MARESNITYIFRIMVALFVLSVMVGCKAQDALDAVKNKLNEPPKKSLDYSRLGVNAFFNDPNFGSIESQADEIKNTLRLKRVRVLFAWNSLVQPSPFDEPNFSHYDDIEKALSFVGLQAIAVLTGLPDWMHNPATWTHQTARETFSHAWVKKVAQRYANSSSIIGYEIWNEPNMTTNNDNITMDFIGKPLNFLSLVCLSYSIIKDISPSKLVINGATTSINQSFPTALDYNKEFHKNGVENCIDVFAIHVYGKQFERYDQGIKTFLNGVTKPIWVTESGAQGVNSQLSYGKQVWPFLRDKISGIDWIFIYQFAENTPPDITYGLRNLSMDFPVSDLYIDLRDRP